MNERPRIQRLYDVCAEFRAALDAFDREQTEERWAEVVRVYGEHAGRRVEPC